MCLMSQSHEVTVTNRDVRRPSCSAILNNTLGKAKQFVCDAEIYRFRILTDFHTSAASKFGLVRKMLYLCSVESEG